MLGDVTGTSAASVVSKINGTSVPATPTAGQTLFASSGTAATWRAIAATDLPSLLGDVTGPTSATVVGKVNGTSVPATPSANQFLVASSGTAATWRALVAGDIPAGASITMAGDVTGTSGASTVVGLTGTANVVAMHGTAITWDAASAAPLISQATQATTGKTLTVQAANVTTGTGSNVVLQTGTGSVAAGVLQVWAGATQIFTLDYNAGAAYGRIAVPSSLGGLQFSAPATGQELLFAAPQGTAQARFQTSKIIFQDANNNALVLSVNTLTPSSATTLSFSQYTTASLLQDAPTSDVATNTLTVKAADAWASAVTNTSGATLNLSSGYNTGAAVRSLVSVQSAVIALTAGGTTAMVMSSTALTSYLRQAWNTALAPNFDYASIPVAAANITLTNTQWNRLCLRFPTATAAITITMPLQAGGVWVVTNPSTQYALTFWGGSGGTATLAATKTGIVWTDGTNFYGGA
ncbi:MAG: hypothetical protein NVS3B7_16820 [Candidatus Elarobacter sp.]